MVADYIEHFLELLTRVKSTPNDEERNIYTNSLVEPLKMQVELLKPATLEDVMDGTVSYEHLASVTYSRPRLLTQPYQLAGIAAGTSFT